MHELQAALCARTIVAIHKMEHWLGVALGERRISTPEHCHHRSCSLAPRRENATIVAQALGTPSVPHHSPFGWLSDFRNAVSNTGFNKLI